MSECESCALVTQECFALKRRKSGMSVETCADEERHLYLSAQQISATVPLHTAV